MNSKELWYHKPLRVIQTNLQVKDTPLMNPARIARDVKALGANVLVMNVGGIYAWYPTKIPGHYMNPYLPKDFDLLKEIVDACHSEGMRVIARFDFSKTDDSNYQLHPRWFRRLPDMKPRVIAAERPGGEWPLLYETCINAGYRNDDVALPVLREALTSYELDGVFFNAPHGAPCCCDACRRKYRSIYGKELPGGGLHDDAGLEPDWLSLCLKDNIGRMYSLVKELRQDIPVILYYNMYHDNLYDRIATCDLLCTEPIDILSQGWQNIPQFWKPALSVKLGCSAPDRPKPFGIVHSCPGIDWRHTGLPPAEYRFWLSQVPANGGMIWHSLTGFPDTITDKRILDCVSDVNHWIERVEEDMDGARSAAQVALMWNMRPSAEGWADLMVNRQTPFDVLLAEQATQERLAGYRCVIVPDGFRMTEALIDTLDGFAQSGGRILIEGKLDSSQNRLFELAGIRSDQGESESLSASYLRFEGNELLCGFERTPIIAHKGAVWYSTPTDGTRTLATLVPPFSPLEGAGAPPERASIMNPRTDIPLITHRAHGKGGVTYVAFEFSRLVRDFKLGEFYQLGDNLIRMALGGSPDIECTHINGLQMTAYRKDGATLVHLVNGAGQRPLANVLPLHNIHVKVRLPEGVARMRCEAMIAGVELDAANDGGWAKAVLPVLDVWEMIRFTAWE